MLFYIISQVFALLAFILQLTAYYRKTKSNIFSNMVASNLFSSLHYLFLGAISGLFTKLIALTRNFIILEKDKYKKLNSNYIMVFFIIIYISLSIITYENIFSILPYLGAAIYTLFTWNGNALIVKKVVIVTGTIWLIYDISALSIVGVISGIITLISNIIAYLIALKENKKVQQ